LLPNITPDIWGCLEKRSEEKSEETKKKRGKGAKEKETR
jgi:hypothetical protein